MVKIVGLSGSPRHGITEEIIKAGLETMEEIPGVETEFLSLAGKNIRPCDGCGYCLQNKCECIHRDDMQSLVDIFVTADAYLIGTPVYVHSITPHLMAFFTRLRPVNANEPEKLYAKLAAAVSVGGARNGGEEAADTILIHMLLSRGMTVVGGESRGYIGGKVWSKDQKNLDSIEDELGMQTVYGLSRKLAQQTLIRKAGMEALNIE